ncbi:hypothetical protein ACQ5SO_19875 [Rhodovulum sp. DZ06]|uniref:hypothetical protein n=1 Tax=Rhodovulum sp. DZ06 TaxID=3425126 RepID=UPI003D3283C2
MKAFAVALILAPAAALAHGGPQGHAHPHGLEGAALVALAMAGFAAWRFIKR